MADETRTCKECEETLPVDEFWWKVVDVRRDTLCKPCRKAKNDAYRRANKDKIRATQRRWDSKNKDKVNASRRRQKAAMSDEDRRRRNQQTADARARMKARRIAEYLALYGTPPVCACGCGEHVRFSDKGIANEYVNQHHPRRAPNQRFDGTHRIPIERVRDALVRIRDERGLTNGELAELAGMSKAHLCSILYDKTRYRRYGLDVKWVENAFRRIQGMPAPPSTYMLSQHEKFHSQNDRIEQQYGIKDFSRKKDRA